MLALLTATEPGSVRLAAAKALGQFDDAGVAVALLTKRRWGAYAPGLREAVTGVLLGRSTYHPALMAALESGVVPIHALSPARRQTLERSKPVGARAKKLFAKQADGDRMKAYELLKPVLKLKADAAGGVKIFTRACALCHTHGSEGYAVGPDLTGLRNQPAETLLLHIIVPNYEVVGGNTMYEVDTKDGQIFAGLLAADTPAQLTLKLPLGFTKTLARSEVKAVRASVGVKSDGFLQGINRFIGAVHHAQRNGKLVPQRRGIAVQLDCPAEVALRLFELVTVEMIHALL